MTKPSHQRLIKSPKTLSKFNKTILIRKTRLRSIPTDHIRNLNYNHVKKHQFQKLT